jgi:23S rRNA-/tRNA-specific pseudouridylate synthase
VLFSDEEIVVDKSLHNKEIKSYQDARTEFKKIAVFGDATLVAAHLKTGKFHQIRRHLHSIDHPIVMLDGRIFLHAYRLEFIQPFSKKKVEIRDPLPEKLLEYLKTLEGYDVNEEIINGLL